MPPIISLSMQYYVYNMNDLLQLSDENGDSVTVMEHPVRNSLAWQWVKTCIPSDGTSRYSIKLGLDSANVSRRQSGGGGGNVFFDDVEVRSTVMVDEPGWHTHTHTSSFSLPLPHTLPLPLSLTHSSLTHTHG